MSTMPIRSFGFTCALAATIVVGSTSIARGDVKPSPLFTDNAVIQRDSVTFVWGSADPGEKVEVSFAGRRAETVADASGEWKVALDPMQGGLHGTLGIRGKNSVQFANVVTGDVWLCSGQSNMGRDVATSANGAAEVAAANEPDIRQFRVPQKSANEPQTDRFVSGGWQPALPKTVGKFTAAGYYFAREIHAQVGIPIGIIHSSWGGTPIVPWIPLGSVKAFSGYAQMLQREQADLAAWPARKLKFEESLKRWNVEVAAAKAAGKPIPDKPWDPGSPSAGQNMPGELYNGMIHPLLNYRIRGALWYQGEANAGSGARGAADYAELQTLLIEGWRKSWAIGDFPFYYVQLPNFGSPTDPTRKSWAFFREGQAAVRSVKNTDMAVLIDIGETNNIHPLNKQEAGRRLALLALAGTYGKSVSAHGPELIASAVEGNAIRVRLRYATKGLVWRGEAPAKGFEVAGADGKFVPASAMIDGDTLLVMAKGLGAPCYVRYAWADDPVATLFNGDGLPAMPFRTDSFSE